MEDREIRKICCILCTAAAMLAAGCTREQADDLPELELEQAQADKAEDSDGVTGRVEQDNPADPSQEEPSGGMKETVFVYVCGAVNAPGVYELASDARVYEAVESAGGVKEGAAGEALNQAQLITDGERIYIPTREELEQGFVDGLVPEVTGTDNTGKININTAAKEELKTLPGIGDAKADSIIAYREAAGAFQTVEELMQVEGIKEGVFNKIKDKITAGK